MEELVELIITILFMPFERQYDGMFGRINNIKSKVLRILLKLLILLIPLIIIWSLCCLFNYLFRRYWI